MVPDLRMSCRCWSIDLSQGEAETIEHGWGQSSQQEKRRELENDVPRRIQCGIVEWNTLRDSELLDLPKRGWSGRNRALDPAAKTAPVSATNAPMPTPTRFDVRWRIVGASLLSSLSR